MSTCHFSPGFPHSCPSLGISVAAALLTETRGPGKFIQIQIVPSHRNRKMSSSHYPFYPEPTHLKCSEMPSRNPSQRSQWHFSAEGILVSRPPWQAAHCGGREKVSRVWLFQCLAPFPCWVDQYPPLPVPPGWFSPVVLPPPKSATCHRLSGLSQSPLTNNY